MSNNCSSTYDFVRLREQGIRHGRRSRQLGVQENLITNNVTKLNTSKIAFTSRTESTKAFLIVMSIDMCYFAVSTSDNCIGIYDSVTGELIKKLFGSDCPLYTITWHPHMKNIIACSNLGGAVFIWNMTKEKNRDERQPLHQWDWPSYSSIAYTINFHPYSTIMTIARDREIRFINWDKGHHIAHWRYFAEFALVPWVSWTAVGTSLLVAVGNPPDDSVLHSIMTVIGPKRNSCTPYNTNCKHRVQNRLCDDCDGPNPTKKIFYADDSFQNYKITAVDLTRYILSRKENWYEDNFICEECRIRFQLWANCTTIHDNCEHEIYNGSPIGQLRYDVRPSLITVIECPVSPEVFWDTLQALEEDAVPDSRLIQYIVPKDDPELEVECRQLLRCVAMFERECLRKSICWCCIQQIQNWVMQQDDFPRFLHDELLEVQGRVEDRVKHLEMEEIQYYEPDPTLSIMEQERQIHEKAYMLAYGNEMPSEYEDDSNSSISSSISDDDSSIVSNDYDNPDKVVFDFSTIEDPVMRAQAYDIYYGNVKDESIRLRYLQSTLKLLQIYVSEPSKLGDLINVLLNNNLNRMGMLYKPSLYGSKVESYTVRRWYCERLGQPTAKIAPRPNLSKSNVVVPFFIFSATGLTTSSIKMSKCYRYIAVFVPQHAFKRLHSIDQGQTNVYTRKRCYQEAFKTDTGLFDPENSPSREKGNVIAIYTSEPESQLGQLLYYFEMPYDPISLDFSPRGNLLLVGLSGSKHQSMWTWPTTDKSSVDKGNPLNTHCNIGAILKINNDNVDGTEPIVRTPNASRMQLKQILQHERCEIFRGCGDKLSWNGPVNCAIWNTAGGLLFCKEPGMMISVNFGGSAND